MKFKPATFIQSIHSLFTLALIGVGAWMGLEWGRARIAEEIYAERLGKLATDYAALREDYNRAIARTAVTLLNVHDGQVSVEVLAADGTREIIPTPFPADAELYVDYLVQDGRLWIRRVFDDQTPPASAVVIDPKLAQIDWEAEGLHFGKAVYRQLGEGRWVVTVTGNGSLGLMPAPEGLRTDLTAAPAILDYTELQAEIDRDVQALPMSDVVAYLWQRR